MSSSKKDSKSKHSSDKKKHKDYEEYEKKHKDYEDKEKKHNHEEENHHADVAQDADQYSSMDQESNELIYIKDSCNIDVQSTSTQAAISLQVALQLAIALVLKITIGDSEKGDDVAQDLLQFFDSDQLNKQKIVIDNSKDIKVTTTDTDLTVNIQALLQVLLTLVAKIDIL